MKTSLFSQNPSEFSNNGIQSLIRANGKIAHQDLFIYYFNCLPNTYEINQVDAFKMKKEICEFYEDFIIKELEENNYNPNSRKMDGFTCIVLFNSAEMIEFQKDKIIYYFDKEDLLSKKYLNEEAHRNCIKTQLKATVKLVTKNQDGLELTAFNMEASPVDLLANYNSDIHAYHSELIGLLNHHKKNGLHFLHGKSGTGKTHYLKQLLCETTKNIIFIPAAMAGCISDPDFLNLLIKNVKDHVLIIDGAEQILSNTEQGNKAGISTLLNLTDGLLSDLLNLQIICTMNADIQQLDPALLRSGRLLSQYEFNELSTKKAGELSAKLGYHRSYANPAVLCDVYNNKETQIFSLQTKQAV